VFIESTKPVAAGPHFSGAIMSRQNLPITSFHCNTYRIDTTYHVSIWEHKSSHEASPKTRHLGLSSTWPFHKAHKSCQVLSWRQSSHIQASNRAAQHNRRGGILGAYTSGSVTPSLNQWSTWRATATGVLNTLSFLEKIRYKTLIAKNLVTRFDYSWDYGHLYHRTLIIVDHYDCVYISR
jgi:hypothetical protein